MSKPHFVVPGQVIAASRQTLHRRFVLRPDPQTVLIIKYLLALCAEKHGVILHVFCLMSTHYHIVFTDARGNRGEFFRDFHALVTRCLQVSRGLGRSYVFDKGETSQLDCVTSTGVVEAVAYALANPTAAGITSEPSQWPGNFCNADELASGKVERIRRPDTFRHERGHLVRYFDLTGDTWPEHVELRFEPVPMLEAEGIHAAEYERRVQAHLKALIHEKVAEVGAPFSRVTKALRRRITTQAVQELAFGECSPRIKAGAGETEARVAAIRQLQEFWTLHAEAVANVKAGRSAVFPLGSYRWLRVFAFSTAT